VWFARRGLVDTGLVGVRVGFSDLPGFDLGVVGPVEDEPEFVKLYHKELHHRTNIKLIGWMDKEQPEFKQLLDRSVAHIFTSCSESGAACVLETMGAGVIPVVNYESSVDVDDFGILLKSASIEDIKEGVRMVGAMPADELKRRARKAWEKVQNCYTRERFAESYRALLTTLLERHGKSSDST
jgi:glycosyltransferase involved in cell wall biosynthesis